MALIECPECHQEVSDKAAACPHCGHPIAATKNKKPTSRHTRQAFGMVLLTGLLILAVIQGGKKETGENWEIVTDCTSDWHKCADNAGLINNYHRYDLQTSCKMEAEHRARYGTPKWASWLTFETFLAGDEYPKTGIAILIENDAQFSNVFGAMVHSTVECTYDLNQGKVVNISVIPK